MPPNAHVSGEYLRLGESLKNNCKWASQPPLAKCRPSSWCRSILCPVVPCLHHYPVYLLELARSTKLRDIPFVKKGKSVCMNTNIYIVANCRCFVASLVLLSCLQAKRQGSGNQPTASIIHLVLNGLYLKLPRDRIGQRWSLFQDPSYVKLKAWKNFKLNREWFLFHEVVKTDTILDCTIKNSL